MYNITFMSHTFAPIPAKPTFGTLRPLLYASDYLLQKKAKTLFITNKYNKYRNQASYENRYLYFPQFVPLPNLNRGNLVYGLYSNENLTGVTTLGIEETGEQATTVNPNAVPFYDSYTIDPKGELFGNSQCGINNFVYYAEPNSTIIP